MSQNLGTPVVCTLYEGHYHHGLAALINSLYRAGFAGRMVVGFRGELPPWIGQLRAIDAMRYSLDGRMQIAFERLDVAMHFTNYKPEFLLRILNESRTEAGAVYLDPDITLRCSWNFMEQWSRFGVCLCEEIVGVNMANDHPLRWMWRKLARERGWGEPVRESWRYYNGGFIAVKAEHRRFLEVWRDAIGMIEETGASLSDFGPRNREYIFHMADQDALNLAVMYTSEPLSTVGPEGMGFVPGGFTMYHATGATKPWRKPFLVSALRGVPPSGADKDFLEKMDGPIRAYSRWQLLRKRLACNMAALMGRFYARR